MTLIAEIGQNHCGEKSIALRLIKLAKENGADLVKFQLYSHEKLYKDHPEVPNVELQFWQAQDLFDYGELIGIEVFFSVFDVERVKWCEKIGVKRYKIASGMRDETVLRALLSTDKPLIVSSKDRSSPNLMGKWYSNTKWLYCPPGYPSVVNNQYPVPDFDECPMDGFSDHSIGLDVVKIALARGSQMTEKHFAIDHETGIDAPWSMTPDELRELKRWETVCKGVL